MGSLSYGLLAIRQEVCLGAAYDEFCYISAIKHSKITKVKRRMEGHCASFLTC